PAVRQLIGRLGFSGEPPASQDRFARGSPLSIFLTPLREPLPQDRLEAAVGRLVISPLFRQILLLDVAALVIVAVLVLLPVAEILGPTVVGVPQVLGDRQRPAFFHVLAGGPDGQRRCI